MKLSLAQQLILLPVRFYRRFLSPLKASPSCRFHPTCSAYAVQAVEQRGALRGSYLALRRLLKCHPFHPGGFDPVPAAPVTINVEVKGSCEAHGTPLTRRNFER